MLFTSYAFLFLFPPARPPARPPGKLGAFDYDTKQAIVISFFLLRPGSSHLKFPKLFGRTVTAPAAADPIPVSAASTAPITTGVALAAVRKREVAAMARRFPAVAALCEEGIDSNAYYLQLVRLIGHAHPAAREAAWRTSLNSIRSTAAERAIAESDLAEGIPFSSNIRRFPDLWDRARHEARRHEDAYGAPVFTEMWPSLSRGRALVHYFENHSPSGRILHIAPEADAEPWFRSGGFDYQTLGLGAQTDFAEDLTALPMVDDSYDWIICHRVLEHIFDEPAALAELKRILKPQGVLNISVPESMHLAQALDWCIPDPTHHNHYRHYGSDFAARLEAAGFEVECIRWLLDRPAHSLREAGTFPLRFYHASKR